ncbi:unnamed protein product [Darwinula stevensoni]|uniref:Uncharacterized protein n=1 Tax=Darwinula stevensoni TaxID=69355 RepID=A0A7R8XI56_9CRUS|nr:unnamed protein product [Darwinula stevensoni]CAG0893138.1 unnamed protein product [Darwinula stevensoni]
MRRANKVAIDGLRGKTPDIQFEDGGELTVGVGPVTARFLNRFSAHALGRSVYPDSSRFRKVFWFFAFLIATGYTIYGIIDTINLYMAGLLMTSTQMVIRDKLPFPTVTICPNRPSLKDSFDLKELSPPHLGLFKLNEDLVAVIQSLSRPENSCRQTTEDFSTLNNTDFSSKNNDGQKTCIKPFDALFRLANPSKEYLNWVEVLMGSNSYTLEDFRKIIAGSIQAVIFDISKSIRNCSFNGKTCTLEDFTIVETDILEKCLTFNYKGDKEIDRLKTTISHNFVSNIKDINFGEEFQVGMNPTDGLQLILASYSSKDAIIHPPGEGFRLVIHNPDTVSNTLRKGFNVNLQMLCVHLCYATHVIRNLEDGRSCMETFFPDLVRRSKNKTKDCIPHQYNDSGLGEKVFKDEGFCGCPQPCTERKFQWSLTSVQMNRENDVLLGLFPWMKYYWKMGHKKIGIDELRNKIYCNNRDETLAVVNVYFENMAVEVTKETLIYPWSSFIGSLGGLLGLYTGISFVSIMEIVEWIIDLLLYGWRKPRQDQMGPKRRIFLTWKDDTPGQEKMSTRKEVIDLRHNLEDPPVNNRPAL